MSTSTAFDRIHNINPKLNRIFSIPLYLFSLIVLLFFFVSPYLLRVGFALLVNVLLNRPIVYLNYFARFAARPMNRLMMSAFFIVVIGAYAVMLRIFGQNHDSLGWSPSDAASDEDTLRFQS